MSQFDRHGPKNLDRLFGNMVDYMRKDGATRISLKSSKQPEGHPTAFCPICLVVHERTTLVVGDTQMKSKNCPECQEQLDQGGIAIKCADGRHSFVWCDALVDKGPIIEVGKEEYDAIEAYVAQSKKDAENGQD